jgi:Exo-beta-D-glucosaminidase Ig-fold domain/Glycosyl hydrolases family 2/F5/8 type C domain/Glycosyl hydrolases family 2, sugar binding domain
MKASRREFLKATAITGAGAAMARLSALAEPMSAQAEGSSPAAGRFPDTAGKQEYTRGVGIYPGAPGEDFSPELVPATGYRNLALLRPAYHSSSYDYNLTAQLVTDGIKDTRLPDWVAISQGLRGPLPKEEREVIVDHSPMVPMEVRGPRLSVDIQIGGGDSVPEVDSVQLFVVPPSQVPAASLRFSLSVSPDGRTWQEYGSVLAPKPASTAGYPPDFAAPGRFFTPLIPLKSVSRSRYYRVECSGEGIPEDPENADTMMWRLSEVAFFHGSQRIQIGGPYSFTSAWMSAGLGEEWIYVDLGARFQFDHVKLYWIARAAEGSLQVSDDAENWRDLMALPPEAGLLDDLKLAQPAQGRYVRVLMTRPVSPYGYILSEIEVYGSGGIAARPKPAPPATADGRLLLVGGAWKLQRSSLVNDGGESLSKIGFQDSEWIVATVPGTVLTSYLNIGAIPDPNFGENQLHVSDSFFYSDFWYRTEFTAPAVSSKQTAWLNFDGINWKAEIYLNGEKLGRIEGGFMRGRFDVTGKLIPGKVNALAVRIEKNATPGSAKQKTFASAGKNGGAPGADNPTYHASIGWDWISTIRGRNTGIWGDVSLTLTGAVTIEDPFLSTSLPNSDNSIAEITLAADLVNHSARPLKGTLRGRIGDLHFEQRITLAAMERKKIKLDPTTIPSLRLSNPRLWWPAGYGDANLYDVELSVQVGGETLDSRSFKAGLRRMTYSEEGGALKIWINGRRFVARGGNWGFGESMLRFRAREYDAAVRYHREMNFTMIRNWVGQIGDDAFYDACDRHGIMVWQDFWLANPWDGPEPDDDALFLSNVKDLVSRIRNHPSVGLYCGRNEGFPPPTLETGIRSILGDLHPDLHYIPSSADNVVSGHGPYAAMPSCFYFRAADRTLHSEIGAPNIPSIESVRLMMSETALWPQGLSWGLHDFCMQGAMDGASFRDIVEYKYGGAHSAEEWIRLAQFVNYETYRAMFEAQSRYRMGVLLWMSHPCWPSFVWQTYDYYFEPTAAYFGCKKGSEPLHIQWNCEDESIEVVNYSAGNVNGLTAQVEILNMDGTRMSQKSANLDSLEDSTVTPFRMEYPAGLTPVHFLRLALMRGSESVSSNFYLRGLDPGNLRAIRELPKPQLKAATTTERQGNRWQLKTLLTNSAAWPALMVRIKAIREKTGDRILPAIYSDNYVSLMPGESRTLVTELDENDTRGEKPSIVVCG